MKSRFLKILVTILTLSTSHCNDHSSPKLPSPLDKNDGLEVSTPRSKGLDEVPLLEMVKKLEKGEFGKIKSVLVASEGSLVMEQYFGDDADAITSVESVTKSVTSALVGLCVEQYDLELTTPVASIFPELDHLDWSAGKDLVTIENLLTMSSGLSWNESEVPYSDPLNDHVVMYEADNWIEYILSRPMAAEPGTIFKYNSGLSIVLGEIVSRQANQTVDELSTADLFSKLDIELFFWYTHPDGTFQTGGGLYIHPRDMLKFGLLYQNLGNWNGEQILSESWVDLSTQQHGPNPEYGYQWWITEFAHDGKKFNAYYAWGNGGQFIIVVNDLSIVVTVTSDSYEAPIEPRDQVWKLMEEYIIPSAAEK